jgi:hypothetical protein
MKTPIAPVRELCCHALQLADYVLDSNAMSDIFVLRTKALAVKGLINQLYGDLPVTAPRLDLAAAPGAGSGVEPMGVHPAPASKQEDEDVSDLL